MMPNITLEDMPVDRNKSEKKSSFEENMERLETIVRELEAGSLSLEDALKRFEEGVRLYRLCEERLKDAEQRIEILLRQADGTVIEAPFEASGAGGGEDADSASDPDTGSATPPDASATDGAPDARESRPFSGRVRSSRRSQEPAPDRIPDDDVSGELPF